MSLVTQASSDQVGGGRGGCNQREREEVVCEGEKTREERDAELRGEAVLLDE
jgi:hypothetical protein